MSKTETFGSIKVVQRSDYKWGIVDNEGNEIVPFGKYGWIEDFDVHGLSRVRTPKLKDFVIQAEREGADLCEDDIYNLRYFSGDKAGAEKLKHPLWGIIDMQGNEVLPVEYDSIWKFYDKDRDTTQVEKDGEEFEFSLETKEIVYKDDQDNYDDYSDYDSYDSGYSSRDYEADTWDALTDGQYGDMPDDFDGDYSFLGY